MKPSKDKQVFIAYRHHTEHIARQITEELEKRGLKTWFFPRKVGFGDSITKKEEEGLDNSTAAIIILSSDYNEGKTFQEEYKAIMAYKREKPDFKVGFLLWKCDPQDIPGFGKDYYYVKLSSLRDPDFHRIIDIIYNGLLDLPLETDIPFKPYTYPIFHDGTHSRSTGGIDAVTQIYMNIDSQKADDLSKYLLNLAQKGIYYDEQMIANINDVYSTTGDGDFIIQMNSPNIEYLMSALNIIRQHEGVAETRTNICLRLFSAR